MENNNNNTLLIAGSIVAAGALIALGIYFAPTGTTDNTANNNGQNEVETTAEINTAEVTEEDHVRGNIGATVTVIDYSDFECPFCKRFHQTMKRLDDKYDDDELAWVYRHFPLEQLHSKAPAEANAAECAASLGGNEAFWQYADRIFEVTPSNNGLDLDQLPEIAEDIGLDRAAFTQCQENMEFEDAVDADLSDARSAGGTGTPYVVIELNEEPSDAVKEQLNALAAQSRGRITLNEERTKLATSGALPFEAMDQLMQLFTEGAQAANSTSSESTQ